MFIILCIIFSGRGEIPLYFTNNQLRKEVLTIENLNDAKDVKRISEQNLIKLLAINNKYQQYINNEIEQEPEVVEAEDHTVVLPKTKEELDTLIQFPYQSASTDAPLKFKSKISSFKRIWI